MPRPKVRIDVPPKSQKKLDGLLAREANRPTKKEWLEFIDEMAALGAPDTQIAPLLNLEPAAFSYRFRRNRDDSGTDEA